MRRMNGVLLTISMNTRLTKKRQFNSVDIPFSGLWEKNFPRLTNSSPKCCRFRPIRKQQEPFPASSKVLMNTRTREQAFRTMWKDVQSDTELIGSIRIRFATLSAWGGAGWPQQHNQMHEGKLGSTSAAFQAPPFANHHHQPTIPPRATMPECAPDWHPPAMTTI